MSMPNPKRPAQHLVQEIGREEKPDGTIIIHFNRGGKVIIPPRPTDPEWWERVRNDMSAIAYRIARRVAAEKRDSEEE